jgi:glycosyltransferase involved in cell wall biosynthesis
MPSSPPGNALRIACLGWAQWDGGSIASANALLLRELTRRGHHIDFFAADGYLPDPGLSAEGAFRFVPVVLSEPRLLAHLDRWTGGRLGRLRGQRYTRIFRQQVVTRVRAAADSGLPYDAVLSLGTAPPRIHGVPVIAWPQGLPGGELAVLRARRRLIVGVSGWPSYLVARGFHELRDVVAWGWLRHSTIIVASQASRDGLLRRGIDGARIAVIPYAIDLERFSAPPSRDSPEPERKTLLCLGRLDPRKRVDLLVDAVAILASRRTDFVAHVVGREGFPGGWASLVEEASTHLPIRYSAQVPHAVAASLVSGATVLVQPSEDEEFGHAVAEALASGTPVVVGPTNHTREYVRPGTGVLFEAYTPDALADAMDEALEMTGPGVAAACREAASGAFRPEGVAAAVEASARPGTR